MRRLLFPHLVVWVLVIAVLRITLVPAEVCPRAGADEIRTAIDRAVAWLDRGIGPDGRYVYGYTRGDAEPSADYNVVRHAGVTMSLYRLAAAGQEGRLAVGDRALPFILDNLIRHDGWAAFAVAGGDASIGANALTVAALAHRRLATGDGRYDDLMRELSDFLVAQQLADGSMLGRWSQRTQEPVPGSFAKFGTGEAFWALGLMRRLFPDESWDEPARAVASYLATRRDDAEGYGTALPDHWAAYGLDEIRALGLTEEELTYARNQAGYFGTSTRFESQSGQGWLSHLTRGGDASGAGLGTIGEALGSYWRLSRSQPELGDLESALAERLRCNAGRAVARQADAADAASSRRPSLVEGAWFTDGYTQMDDQQHLISALLAALAVVDDGAADEDPA
ncbi:MAG: hypothetical protein ACE5EV_01055 [Gaiellales bacterium]